MAKRYTRNKRRRKTRKIRGGFDLNETIPHTDDDSHFLNIDNDDSFQSQGSLHPSDLDISQINDIFIIFFGLPSAVLDFADDLFGHIFHQFIEIIAV